MIQRVQSIYLFCAGLAIFALFLFPIAHHVYVGTSPKTIKIDGIYENVGTQLVRSTSFLALTIVTIVVGIIPLVILFLYKNRKQQIALSYGLILALFGFSYWMSETVKGHLDGVMLKFENFGIGAALTSVSIVFLLLAVKAIQRDEKLIKSADRLR